MDKQNLTKHYTNGEITIVWKPGMCTHSTKCWKGIGALPEVFNPAERPWIKPEGASSERIIEQIEMCPSKALTWKKNEG
ncbi:MAG: (4Fe-4S)-binding protein [Bacteroidia bacterium]|nr:(4Fe-4S)-binding protein [Bacteroidia bacterium]